LPSASQGCLPSQFKGSIAFQQPSLFLPKSYLLTLKHLVVGLALLLASPLAQAQKAPKVKDNDSLPALPTDPDTHLVDYSAVVEVAGATQDQLYTRAYDWVTKTYAATAASALQDKEKGRLTVQGTTHPHYRGNEFGIVTHTFSIYVKEGKYKYDFTNFRHDYVVTGPQGGNASLGPFENEEPKKMVVMAGLMHRVWNSIRNETDGQVKVLIADLEASMQGKTKDKGDF
jgi:hypothetical protein